MKSALKKTALVLAMSSLTLGWLPNVAMAEDYKLGVVLFVDTSNIDAIDYELDAIKRKIASNDVYRQRGSDTLQLVVQTEIPWNDTNPDDNYYSGYDFSQYVKYAEKLKKRGIKWTPLFPIHHPPEWVLRKYMDDWISDKEGKVDLKNDGFPSNKVGNFIHMSPSSQVWRKEARIWLQAGIEALSPYIGTDKNSTISEFFVTNETMYRQGGLNYDRKNDDRSVITSYDEATIRAWKRRYGGDIPRNLTQETSSRINDFMKFRSEELAYCLSDLRKHMKNKLTQIGKRNIPVTWKLTPFSFDAGDGDLQQYNGWNKHGLNYLFRKTGVSMIGIDEYEGGNDSNDLIEAINKTRRYTNKPIYLAEFNRKNGGASSEQVKDWIIDTKNHGVTNWTFFSWNGGKNRDPQKTPKHELPIENSQIEGLRQAFDNLLESNESSGENEYSQKIDAFYNKHKSFFGSKVGGNYNCYGSFVCQDFSRGNTKIAVKKSNSNLYWYNGKGRWFYVRNI